MQKNFMNKGMFWAFGYQVTYTLLVIAHKHPQVAKKKDMEKTKQIMEKNSGSILKRKNLCIGS